MQNTYYNKIVKLSFWALFFFTIWGTDIPFSQSNVPTEPSSSAFNQLLYGILFLVSVIVLISRKKDVFKLVKDEKFLTLFILFALLSMLWSDDGITTFKRVFQLISIFLISISFLIYTDSEDEIIKPLKYIIYPYLVVTLIAIVGIPDARGADGMWKGLTNFKNELGQLGVLAAILCYIIYKREDSKNGKLVAGFMIFLSSVLTLGSRSSTSILTLFILFGLGALLLLDRIFIPLRIGKTISTITITLFFLGVFGFMAVGPDLNEIVPELFGKDASFSGRSELWDYLLNINHGSRVIGCGYEAFWIQGSNRIIRIYEEFIWLPLQAHNGYIDILLSMGYVGLFLLSMIFLNYFANFIKINKPHPWILFIIVALVTNFQESSILRIGQKLNFIFIFAYLLLFVNKYKNFNWSKKSELN